MQPDTSRRPFLAQCALVVVLGLGLLAGCSDTIRESQISQYQSVEHLTDKLFKMKILSSKDRLLVVRLPYPHAAGDLSSPSPAAKVFFDDAFVSGLLKDGAVVMQGLAVSQSPVPGAVTKMIGGLAAQPATGDTPAILSTLLAASRIPGAGDQFMSVGGRTVAIGRVGNSLTDFGITKVLLYRWVYHLAADSNGDDTPGFTGNRVFVRVVDAATGYVIWSDLLVSRER